VTGAQLGVRLGERLRADHLRLLLAVLVLGVAGRIAIDLVRQPAEMFVMDVRG
jgi:uncharacterized protein